MVGGGQPLGLFAWALNSGRRIVSDSVHADVNTRHVLAIVVKYAPCLALVAARSSRLQTLAEGGDHRATTALQIRAKFGETTAAVQVGVTLLGTLAAERQAITDYAERAEQAEDFGDEGLETELENIIAEETRHAEEFEKLLAGAKRGASATATEVKIPARRRKAVKKGNRQKRKGEINNEAG